MDIISPPAVWFDEKLTSQVRELVSWAQEYCIDQVEIEHINGTWEVYGYIGDADNAYIDFCSHFETDEKTSLSKAIELFKLDYDKTLWELREEEHDIEIEASSSDEEDREYAQFLLKRVLLKE